MDIRYSGRKVSITQGIRDHVETRLDKFNKYSMKIVESHLILKKQKYRYEAEITALAKNLKVYGDGESKDNIFSAIDLAATRVEKQLKKHRDKIKNHHKVLGTKEVAQLLNEGTGKKTKSKKKAKVPSVIEEFEAFAAKPMTIAQASEQLHLSPDPLLVFKNRSSKKVNVLFKRDDGHHGLVKADEH